MNIHYALYDPAVSTAGNYWTWASPEIEAPLLNRLYVDVAAKHLPPKPNDLQTTDLWGGLIRLADWTVVYRYYNGGWSSNPPRPERYVMLTAWIPAIDAEGVDLLPILTNDTFQFVAKNAEEIPVPEPNVLRERLTAMQLSAVRFQEGEKQYSTLPQAIKTFASVPSSRKARYVIAHLKIIQTAKEQKYELNVEPELLPEPPQSSKRKNSIETKKMPNITNPSRYPSTFHKTLKIYCMCIFLALLVFGGIWYYNINRTSNESNRSTQISTLSPTSSSEPTVQIETKPQQIENLFRQLLPEERWQVLTNLQRIHDVLTKQEPTGERVSVYSSSQKDYVPPPLDESRIKQESIPEQESNSWIQKGYKFFFPPGKANK